MPAAKRILLVGGPLHGVVITDPLFLDDIAIYGTQSLSFSVLGHRGNVYHRQTVWIPKGLSRIRFSVFGSDDTDLDSIPSNELLSLVTRNGIPPEELQPLTFF
jgi:hypothetical protein